MKLLDRKVSLTMAVRKTLKKYKSDFEDLFNLENESESEEEEEGSETESEESD